MSNVTLETLKAEHKLLHKKKANLLAEMRALAKRCNELCRSSHFYTSKYRAISLHIEELRERHTLLTIQIKHGLEAAMLYKLSNGAIDPRNKADDA